MVVRNKSRLGGIERLAKMFKMVYDARKLSRNLAYIRKKIIITVFSLAQLHLLKTCKVLCTKRLAHYIVHLLIYPLWQLVYMLLLLCRESMAVHLLGRSMMFPIRRCGLRRLYCWLQNSWLRTSGLSSAIAETGEPK